MATKSQCEALVGQVREAILKTLKTWRDGGKHLLFTRLRCKISKSVNNEPFSQAATTANRTWLENVLSRHELKTRTDPQTASTLSTLVIFVPSETVVATCCALFGKDQPWIYNTVVVGIVRNRQHQFASRQIENSTQQRIDVLGPKRHLPGVYVKLKHVFGQERMASMTRLGKFQIAGVFGLPSHPIRRAGLVAQEWFSTFGANLILASCGKREFTSPHTWGAIKSNVQKYCYQQTLLPTFTYSDFTTTVQFGQTMDEEVQEEEECDYSHLLLFQGSEEDSEDDDETGSTWDDFFDAIVKPPTPFMDRIYTQDAQFAANAFFGRPIDTNVLVQKFKERGHSYNMGRRIRMGRTLFRGFFMQCSIDATHTGEQSFASKMATFTQDGHFYQFVRKHLTLGEGCVKVRDIVQKARQCGHVFSQTSVIACVRLMGLSITWPKDYLKTTAHGVTLKSQHVAIPVVAPVLNEKRVRHTPPPSCQPAVASKTIRLDPKAPNKSKINHAIASIWKDRPGPFFVIDDPNTNCRTTSAILDVCPDAKVVAVSCNESMAHAAPHPTVTNLVGMSTDLLSRQVESGAKFDGMFLDYCSTPQRSANHPFDWVKDVRMAFAKLLTPKSAVFVTFSTRQTSRAITLVRATITTYIPNVVVADVYQYKDTSAMVALTLVRADDTWTDATSIPRLTDQMFPKMGDQVRVFGDDETWTGEFRGLSTLNLWNVYSPQDDATYEMDFDCVVKM